MNERIKKYCIFVSHYIHKCVRTRLYATGIFYASLLAIYGSAPPCNFVIGLLPLWCNATGKAEPFFISATNTFLYEMTYIEKNATVANNSNSVSTPNGAKSAIPNEFINDVHFKKEESRIVSSCTFFAHD